MDQRLKEHDLLVRIRLHGAEGRRVCLVDIDGEFTAQPVPDSCHIGHARRARRDAAAADDGYLLVIIGKFHACCNRARLIADIHGEQRQRTRLPDLEAKEMRLFQKQCRRHILCRILPLHDLMVDIRLVLLGVEVLKHKIKIVGMHARPPASPLIPVGIRQQHGITLADVVLFVAGNTAVVQHPARVGT